MAHSHRREAFVIRVGYGKNGEVKDVLMGRGLVQRKFARVKNLSGEENTQHKTGEGGTTLAWASRFIANFSPPW